MWSRGLLDFGGVERSVSSTAAWGAVVCDSSLGLREMEDVLPSEVELVAPASSGDVAVACSGGSAVVLSEAVFAAEPVPLPVKRPRLG